MNPHTLMDDYSDDALKAIADVEIENVVASVGLQWPMPIGCVKTRRSKGLIRGRGLKNLVTLN